MERGLDAIPVPQKFFDFLDKNGLFWISRALFLPRNAYARYRHSAIYARFLCLSVTKRCFINANNATERIITQSTAN